MFILAMVDWLKWTIGAVIFTLFVLLVWLFFNSPEPSETSSSDSYSPPEDSDDDRCNNENCCNRNQGPYYG